uniref:Uncharacterized protein n=2 Tax=Lactuca sativa TaxID=4236 RepID=A0A9R1XBJ7_LACSA|nr:hypothetical protein LSAT_V11C500287840 [Lactuca sativa]KAJ0206821.1 hypothetical protein LSAT_V11C500287770 [Lactuca sativa]
MFYFYWKDREEVFLKPDPLTPNINLYAPTPLKRTLEIFFRLISANQMSRILKQSRDITIDFHPLFSSISLLSPKSTLLTGDGHSGQREDREEILVIFTAAVILFQQDAKKLVHVMMLAELSRREGDANIKPDPDIDVFMKAAATEG